MMLRSNVIKKITQMNWIGMYVCLFIHTATIQYFLKTKIKDCNVIAFWFV